ncbi:copper chaperone PCu(A)C [Corynebacterium sp. L4756]|uniref:copper chaperone PCu(A)C n=1 Tax=unclassified Corynebacterium TaxID=2624378 RepID=UPI00374D24E0
MTKPSRLLVSAIAASALALAGCSNSEQDSTQNDSAQTGAAEETTADDVATSDDDSDDSDDDNDSDDDLDFEDAVVRAMDEDADMTAIFGTLVNETSEDIEVVGFSSSIDAGVNEIHETVDGQMREMQEPLIIPAGETVTLEPGGAHFMLMEVNDAVMAGDEVTLTIELSDGSTEDFDDIPVRTIGAGDENYGDLGHGGHDDADDHDH